MSKIFDIKTTNDDIYQDFFKGAENAVQTQSNDVSNKDTNKTTSYETQFSTNEEKEIKTERIIDNEYLRFLAQSEDRIKVVNKIYFKSCKNKIKNSYNIYTSAIGPSTITYLSKDFVTTYKNQIEEIILTPTEDKNNYIEMVVELAILYEKLTKNNNLLYIYNSRYPKYTQRCVYVLNIIFNERLGVIKTVYEMFSGKKRTSSL